MTNEEYRELEGFNMPPCAHAVQRVSWMRETGSFTICADCERCISAPDATPAATSHYDWDNDGCYDEWDDAGC